MARSADGHISPHPSTPLAIEGQRTITERVPGPYGPVGPPCVAADRWRGSRRLNALIGSKWRWTSQFKWWTGHTIELSKWSMWSVRSLHRTHTKIIPRKIFGKCRKEDWRFQFAETKNKWIEKKVRGQNVRTYLHQYTSATRSKKKSKCGIMNTVYLHLSICLVNLVYISYI